MSFSDFLGADQRPSRGRSAGSKLLLCPMAPLCKGSCLRSRLRGCRLTARGSGLPAWWGRSPLGVSFERAKETKTRLGRSPLSTPLGYEAGTASFSPSALAPVGSHRWPGKSIERISFSVRLCLCFQGLTPVCGVPAAGSRASDSWEQRLTRVRP